MSCNCSSRFLTDADTEKRTRAHLTVLGRVWGQDETFLSQHGPHFRQKVRQHRLTRAKWLLCQGRTKEAREELREAGESPAAYRVLAALPGFMTRTLLRMRRAVKGT